MIAPTAKILIVSYLLSLFIAYFAQKRGRNPFLWFAIGLLFGVSSLIALFFLDIKELRKKQKTKKIELPQIKNPLETLSSHKGFWYFLNKEKTSIGPISLPRLLDSYLNNEISNETYVWNEHFEEWKLLKNTKIYSLFLQKESIN